MHLPRARVSLYAFPFGVAEQIKGPQEQVRRARAQLTPLAIDQSLSAEQRAHYLAAIGDMDGLESTADPWPAASSSRPASNPSVPTPPT